jgi:hypothetical protein
MRKMSMQQQSKKLIEIPDLAELAAITMVTMTNTCIVQGGENMEDRMTDLSQPTLFDGTGPAHQQNLESKGLEPTAMAVKNDPREKFVSYLKCAASIAQHRRDDDLQAEVERALADVERLFKRPEMNYVDMIINTLKPRG